MYPVQEVVDIVNSKKQKAFNLQFLLKKPAIKFLNAIKELILMIRDNPQKAQAGA